MAAFRAAIRFDQGSGEVADQLCAIGEYLSLAPGDELAVDTDDDRLIYIASGAAKLLSQARSGSGMQAGSHVLAFQFAGDIVSVLRKPAGGSSLVALSEVDLIAFSANQFLDIAQGDPAVLRAVLVKSLDSLQRTRTRMMHLGHQTARQRIAGFLVSMADRICGCTGGKCEFLLPMGRSDIGDSLGLTIETVSRQFTDLRKEGLVSTPSRSMVCLTDIDALKREAGT